MAVRCIFYISDDHPTQIKPKIKWQRCDFGLLYPLWEVSAALVTTPSIFVPQYIALRNYPWLGDKLTGPQLQRYLAYVYLYKHVLPDGFLLKLVQKEIRFQKKSAGLYNPRPQLTL
jgi:hypothetical protein